MLCVQKLQHYHTATELAYMSIAPEGIRREFGILVGTQESTALFDSNSTVKQTLQHYTATELAYHPSGSVLAKFYSHSSSSLISISRRISSSSMACSSSRASFDPFLVYLTR